MNYEDQATKRFMEFGTLDNAKVERILADFKARNIDADSFWMDNGSMLTPEQYQAAVDFDWAMTTWHTRQLIDLISTYGYPSVTRLKSKEEWDPTFLLEHADYHFRDTIMKLMDHEIAVGRIDSNIYEITRWAMSARTIIPDLAGITIIHDDLKTKKTELRSK